jgi:hypothetical protein
MSSVTSPFANGTLCGCSLEGVSDFERRFSVTSFIKNLVGVGIVVALAVFLRFGLLKAISLDIYVHNTYRVLPLRVISFWVLMGMAMVWFVTIVDKLVRHSF